MGALSVNKDLDRADEMYKAANRMSKRNPSGAKRLKAKAQAIENKAIGRVGRKPRNISVSSTKGRSGKSISLNWY